MLSHVNYLYVCAAAIRPLNFSFSFMLWAYTLRVFGLNVSGHHISPQKGSIRVYFRIGQYKNTYS
jgi:hypothetical protein